MEDKTEDKIDLAEQIMRENDCRLQSFLASGTTQFVVKKYKLSISPSFLSIRELADWVIANRNNLSTGINSGIR
jgi:hypothetical protein